MTQIPAGLPKAFATGLRAALGDDGQVGPNDAPALHSLARALGRADLVSLVDKFAKEYRAPATRRAKTESCATRIVEFKIGKGLEHNRLDPSLALGRPEGKGAKQGSLDVLSLGRGGSITLELGRAAKRGIVVFENAFNYKGRVANPEPALVEVSADGSTWHTLKGLAGFSPVYANSQNRIPLSQKKAGGDRFLFSEAGIAKGEAMKFVRITDVNGTGNGFDLDAVSGF